MVKKRIAIIGAGSPYTPGIIESFARKAEELEGSELVLMDIDLSHMETVTKIARKLVQTTGNKLGITVAADLNESLEKADFVLTTYRVGGLKGLEFDEEIPMKYGVLGDETGGPGGIFYALRTIPATIDLCRKMEKLCPEAWLINYTNPINYISDAVNRLTKVKILSLCNGIYGAVHQIAKILRVKEKDIQAFSAGVNHVTWVLDLQLNGEDIYPLLRKTVKNMDIGKLDWERQQELKLFMTFDYFPSPVWHMVPYYCQLSELLHQRKIGGFETTMDKYSKALSTTWGYYSEQAEKPVPKLDWNLEGTKIYGEGGYHGDMAVDVISAIANNKEETYIVNVPNKGAITNLDSEAIVEVPGIVGASGARPLCMGELPESVKGLIQSLISSQKLAVEAALTGNKRLLLQAVTTNPMVQSLSAAKKICEEMLIAHQDFLPQFK